MNIGDSVFYLDGKGKWQSATIADDYSDESGSRWAHLRLADGSILTNVKTGSLRDTPQLWADGRWTPAP